MPQRPKQHQLEGSSRARFSTLINDIGWACRDKHQDDCGIDQEVEIFKNGKSTGLMFLVQLKSTDSGKPSFSIDVDRLKYYRTLELPVLIVGWDNKNKKFYNQWAHSIDLTVLGKKKKISLTYAKKNEWKQSASAELVSDLELLKTIKNPSLNLPIRTSVEYNFDSIRGYSASKMQTLFKKVCNDEPRIKLVQTDDAPLVKIEISSTSAIIKIVGITSFGLHGFQKKKSKKPISNLPYDLMVGLGFGLARFRHYAPAAELIISYKEKCLLGHDERFAGQIINILLMAGYFKEAVELQDKWMTDDSLFTISFAMYIFKNYPLFTEEKRKEVEEYFLGRINHAHKNKDKELAGISHYNYANYLHNNGFHRKALYHFKQAKKYTPSYNDSTYFRQEVAANLFLLGRYRFAARAYERLLKLNRNKHYKCLYADALMFSGQYEKAEKAFSAALGKSKKSADEWHLKLHCLRYLRKSFKFDSQIRNKELASKFTEHQKGLTHKENIRHFKKAFKHDALCSLAWFNLGVTYGLLNDIDNSTIAYVFAGLCLPNDIEAWNGAILASLWSKKYYMLAPSIIKTSYRINGERQLIDLREALDNKKYDSRLVDKVMAVISECLPANKNSERCFQIRLPTKRKVFKTAVTLSCD